ncbi:hypothetical protein N0V85_007922 [Neurospora sp. IMI 360204]|nr:hypothetical protein N0V85_007922 [Neurospora sp. IMI 360204]
MAMNEFRCAIIQKLIKYCGTTTADARHFRLLEFGISKAENCPEDMTKRLLILVKETRTTSGIKDDEEESDNESESSSESEDESDESEDESDESEDEGSYREQEAGMAGIVKVTVPIIQMMKFVS